MDGPLSGPLELMPRQAACLPRRGLSAPCGGNPSHRRTRRGTRNPTGKRTTRTPLRTSPRACAASCGASGRRASAPQAACLLWPRGGLCPRQGVAVLRAHDLAVFPVAHESKMRHAVPIVKRVKVDFGRKFRGARGSGAPRAPNLSSKMFLTRLTIGTACRTYSHERRGTQARSWARGTATPCRGQSTARPKQASRLRRRSPPTRRATRDAAHARGEVRKGVRVVRLSIGVARAAAGSAVTRIAAARCRETPPRQTSGLTRHELKGPRKGPIHLDRSA